MHYAILVDRSPFDEDETSEDIRHWMLEGIFDRDVSGSAGSYSDGTLSGSILTERTDAVESAMNKLAGESLMTWSTITGATLRETLPEDGVYCATLSAPADWFGSVWRDLRSREPVIGALEINRTIRLHRLMYERMMELVLLFEGNQLYLIDHTDEDRLPPESRKQRIEETTGLPACWIEPRDVPQQLNHSNGEL